MTRRPAVRTLAVIVLALLLTPAAFAGTVTASVDTPDTPHARFGVWIDSLHEFLASHPELTPEQAALVLDAQRLAEPRLFADVPEAEDAKVLADSLQALRQSLSCGGFADLTAGFGELGSWLEAVEVLPAPPPCDCSGAGDCAEGWSCDSSVECISKAGTTHNGICKKNKTTADPAEPIERN